MGRVGGRVAEAELSEEEGLTTVKVSFKAKQSLKMSYFMKLLLELRACRYWLLMAVSS